jgi:energy-coupling factor transporter ATP-binding protein EcfA2
MLFHITGPSGSGKTTLGNQLSKIPNTIIIDTDEIDDTNAMDIITDSKFDELFKNENTINGFFQLLEQRNLEKLAHILETNKDSNIIIVGMTIYPPGETAVQGYSIDVSSNSNYYQLNNRTLDTICSNCVELKDLMENEKNKYKIDLTMLFKYKIRRSFPIIPYQIDEGIELRKKHAQEIGYKYLSQEKIVEDIINLLTKAKTNEANKSNLSRHKAKAKAKAKSTTK